MALFQPFMIKTEPEDSKEEQNLSFNSLQKFPEAHNSSPYELPVDLDKVKKEIDSFENSLEEQEIEDGNNYVFPSSEMFNDCDIAQSPHRVERSQSMKPKITKSNAARVYVYECEICKANFVQSVSFCRHMIVQHGATDEKLLKGFKKCCACGKYLWMMENLLKHYKKRHPGLLRCFCGEAFLTQDTLDEHKIDVHGDVPMGSFVENSYSCVKCNKSFTSALMLNRHKKSNACSEPHIKRNTMRRACTSTSTSTITASTSDRSNVASYNANSNKLTSSSSFPGYVSASGAIRNGYTIASNRSNAVFGREKTSTTTKAETVPILECDNSSILPIHVKLEPLDDIPDDVAEILVKKEVQELKLEPLDDVPENVAEILVKKEIQELESGNTQEAAEETLVAENTLVRKTTPDWFVSALNECANNSAPRVTLPVASLKLPISVPTHKFGVSAFLSNTINEEYGRESDESCKQENDDDDVEDDDDVDSNGSDLNSDNNTEDSSNNMETQTDEKPCSSNTARSSEQYESTEGLRNYECKACGKLFPKRTTRDSHMDSCYGASDRAYCCTKCGESYSSQYERNVHYRNCQKPKSKYQCTYTNCDKSYTRIHRLKLHKNICPNKYPDHYGKQLKRDDDFGIKKGNEGRFKCFKCGKRYKLSGSRDKHMRECIDDTSSEYTNRPYKCDFCICRFASEYYRNLHAEVCEELVEKNHFEFFCSTCNEGFESQRELDDHKALHKATKLYSCSECHQIFAQMFLLRDHWKKVHSVSLPTEYICERCGETYSQVAALIRHTRKCRK